MLNISESSFRRELKKLNLGSPKELLNQYRLEKAHHLIINSDQPFKVVAKLSGFASADYMAKRIQNKYGATPKVLRRQQQGKIQVE